MNIPVVAPYLLLPALLLGMPTARAQPLSPSPAGSPHRILAGVALEPALVTSLGYTYDLGPQGRHAGISVGGGVKVPATVLTNGAWRVHLITSAHWLPEARWGASVTSLAYQTVEKLGLSRGCSNHRKSRRATRPE